VKSFLIYELFSYILYIYIFEIIHAYFKDNWQKLKEIINIQENGIDKLLNPIFKIFNIWHKENLDRMVKGGKSKK